MTNFEVLKKKTLEEVLVLCGFDFAEDVQLNAFMNIFQCIPCSVCPVMENCNGSECCQKRLRNWLESEI